MKEFLQETYGMLRVLPDFIRETRQMRRDVQEKDVGTIVKEAHERLEKMKKDGDTVPHAA